MNYLKDKNDRIESLLNGSIFSEQFFRNFTTSKYPRKVHLNKTLVKVALERILIIYTKLKSSKILRLKLSNKTIIYSRETDFELQLLDSIYGYYKLSPSKKVLNLILEKFQKNIYLKSDSYTEQKSYLSLLNRLDFSKLKFDENILFKHFIQSVTWLDRFDLLIELGEIFPITYEKTLETEFFKEKVSDVITFEMDNINDADIYDLKQSIESVQDSFELDFNDQIEKLNEKEREMEDYIDHQVESYLEEGRFERDDEPVENEDAVIDEIFNSLKGE